MEDDDEERSHPSKRPRVESSKAGTQGNLKRSGNSSDEYYATEQSGLFTTELGPHDVLVGRGGGSNENQGNVHYREAVSLFIPPYLATERRREKDAIARRVVDLVESRGGRFMKKLSPADSGWVQNVDLYVPVSSRVALSKTKQALRFHGKNPQADSRSYHHAKVSSEMLVDQNGNDKKQEHSQSSRVASLGLRPGPSEFEMLEETTHLQPQIDFQALLGPRPNLRGLSELEELDKFARSRPILPLTSRTSGILPESSVFYRSSFLTHISQQDRQPLPQNQAVPGTRDFIQFREATSHTNADHLLHIDHPTTGASRNIRQSTILDSTLTEDGSRNPSHRQVLEQLIDRQARLLNQAVDENTELWIVRLRSHSQPYARILADLTQAQHLQNGQID